MDWGQNSSHFLPITYGLRSVGKGTGGCSLNDGDTKRRVV